jgi:hypothetical protein
MAQTDEERTCPECASVIAQQARKCRYCGANLAPRPRYGLPKWLGGVGLLLVGSLLAVAVPKGWDALFPGLTRTQVHSLRPWQSDELRPGLQVAEEHAAQCLRRSNVSADPDASRCFLSDGSTLGDGSNIVDPCWPAPFAYKAVCLADPWTTRAVLLQPVTLEWPPPDSGNPGTGPSRPWALRLSNDERCTFLPGTQEGVAGKRVNYACAGGEVIGELDRDRAVWRATFSETGARELVDVDVEEVWP